MTSIIDAVTKRDCAHYEALRLLHQSMLVGLGPQERAALSAIEDKVGHGLMRWPGWGRGSWR